VRRIEARTICRLRRITWAVTCTNACQNISTPARTAFLRGYLRTSRAGELGELAGSTNQMIDRLEQTAAERKELAASLESLNRTLEQAT
jgi:HAMP domain-containing protein